MLRSAVDEYFSDKGQYPTMSPACSPGNASECWRNEMWQLLVNEGYLARIPTPDTPSHAAGYNVAGNGNANYGWVRKTDGYAIYVPLEAETYCMTGKNMTSTWWSSARVCDF